MQRTLLAEQSDGTFQCTVTLTPDELPAFLQFGTTPAVKPPTQTMAVSGFEMFGPMLKSGGSDVSLLAHHAPFQRFVESHEALDEDGDSVDHALAYINNTGDVAGLIARYREWHSERWPGEAALPGGV
jgi:hypothetical protein